ncbi:MerR family transcriptional regulator [Ktedonosporobacter rubrisoli]|uniref:MerR family transcriptional regulator n=1 Tax=Ktedonosporobacter rubrisoli TaxID=2509675 RepID=A0A4P6JQR2_KTERU|nr:chaperone modulator CbpM [Ktedonosporobacter rubrisoli]QBD77603.1 MerR family transcriptional regulator [Ktedonosporobacter rubrisoli]
MDEQYIVIRRRATSVYSEQEAAALAHVSCEVIQRFQGLGLIEGVEMSDGERCYEEEELEQMRRMRRIRHDLGVNLAGVEVIVHLLRRIEELERELEDLRSHLSKDK